MSAATAAFLGSGRGVAGDGCAASHFQPRLLLMAELAPIADAGRATLASAMGQKPAFPTSFERAEK
jgi:hypothetical protein